jgi:hypothetical protein
LVVIPVEKQSDPPEDELTRREYSWSTEIREPDRCQISG